MLDRAVTCQTVAYCTFARVHGTELPLDHSIWASYVAPRLLRGVWITAVIVVPNTYGT